MKIAFTTLFLLYSCTASAGVITYYADLNGANESPANASPGTGLAIVTVDDVANTMRVQAWFSGLLGLTTASHIHVINGPGDANTADTLGPVATTTPTFANFPLGVTSGTYDLTLDLTLSSSFNPSFVTNAGSLSAARTALLTGIQGGRAYFNIHSNLFTGGEIRGFLQPVPEPATCGLLAAALAGIALARRRIR